MADQNANDEGTLPAENKKFTEALIREGHLGFWFPRHLTVNPEAWAEIVPEVFRRSVHTTTASALRHLASQNGAVITDARIDGAARSITDAVCVAAYLKIRAANIAVDTMAVCRYPAPRGGVPEPFEIPLPFAAAISALGAFEVVDLPRKMVAVPAVLADAAATFMLGASRRAWDQDAYVAASAFARTLGMRFTAVVPRAPATAWWLFRGAVAAEDDDGGGTLFTLRCVVPETNYIVQDALMHSMFCLDERLGFGAELFRLDGGVAQGDYGSMMRNPHASMNVTAFLALRVSSGGPFHVQV